MKSVYNFGQAEGANIKTNRQTAKWLYYIDVEIVILNLIHQKILPFIYLLLITLCFCFESSMHIYSIKKRNVNDDVFGGSGWSCDSDRQLPQNGKVKVHKPKPDIYFYSLVRTGAVKVIYLGLQRLRHLILWGDPLFMMMFTTSRPWALPK